MRKQAIFVNAYPTIDFGDWLEQRGIKKLKKNKQLFYALYCQYCMIYQTIVDGADCFQNGTFFKQKQMIDKMFEDYVLVDQKVWEKYKMMEN